jgi:hypothetical protein
MICRGILDEDCGILVLIEMLVQSLFVLVKVPVVCLLVMGDGTDHCLKSSVCRSLQAWAQDACQLWDAVEGCRIHFTGLEGVCWNMQVSMKSVPEWLCTQEVESWQSCMRLAD